MKRTTAFTWGYWGWGTHAADFVRNVDEVERARGWRPPLFVDIRIRRTVRAPDFQQNAFEKIVGQRRTCEQWIKEGKGPIKWTRLSCRTFAANAVRLQLHALAYNLGNFLRTLATPEPIKDLSA